eukprot:3505199-Amphidinium_carterae.1
MVTPEEEADFASQPDDSGMVSEGEPEPDDECAAAAASPPSVPNIPVTAEAAAAKAWTEKLDSDPRDVRAKSSDGTQVPTLKRPMMKVPNHPEPEGEPSTPRSPPAKKATGRGTGRPKSPPPPFRKMPPPAGDRDIPATVPLPAGIPPIEPLSPAAEMALRCAWTAIEDGTAHSHNFLMA